MTEEDRTLLLDTSYLLPIFGVGLEYRDFEAVFPALHEVYALRYNPVSLIESKWIVLRHGKKFPDMREALLKSYRRGIFSLEKDAHMQKTILTSEKIEEYADALLTKENISDYFDRLIYSTSAHFNYSLLTEDEKLHDIFKRSRALPKPRAVMRWKNLLNDIN